MSTKACRSVVPSTSHMSVQSVSSSVPVIYYYIVRHPKFSVFYEQFTSISKCHVLNDSPGCFFLGSFMHLQPELSEGSAEMMSSIASSNSLTGTPVPFLVITGPEISGRCDILSLSYFCGFDLLIICWRFYIWMYEDFICSFFDLHLVVIV